MEQALLLAVALAVVARLRAAGLGSEAVALSAASSLASPIGYQTNLMVYGPGGYRSGDYLRFGGLLSVIIWIMIVLLVPWAWPL